MRKNNRTFNQILTRVAEPNLQSLIKRARTANSLAKTTSVEGSKNRAYRVKHNTLAGLRRNFPDKVSIEYDFNGGSYFVVVRVPEKNFGLHAPASQFAPSC